MESGETVYDLMLTNMEVRIMFRQMVRGWFGGRCRPIHNAFLQALLLGDVKALPDLKQGNADKTSKFVRQV